MNNQLLLDNLRCIPDWPIKGVNFRDVTTLFKNPAALKEISDEMYELYKDKGITKIVGIESRGFVTVSYTHLRAQETDVRPYRKVMPRSMVSTPSKSTKMPSMKTT